MDGHTLSLRSLASLSELPRMVFSPRDSDDNDNDDPESSSTTPQDLTVATTVTVTVPTVTVTAAPTPYQDKYEHDGDWSATGTAILASPTPTNPSSLSSLEDHGSGLPSTLQTGYEKAGLIAGVIVAGFAATFLLVLLAMRRRYGASLTRWPFFNRWRGKRTPSLNDGSCYGFRTGPKWLTLDDGDEKGEGWAVTGGQVDSMTRKPSTSFRPHFSPLESPRSSDREEKTARAVPITRLPFRTERLTTRRNKEQSPVGDQSAEADEKEKRSSSKPPPLPPRRIRGPGISYFSWSTTTTPATPASALLLPSNGNRRETMLTDDSEPPRFRSIYSWVNNQSKRQQRGQTGGDGGGAPPIIPSIARTKKNMDLPYPPTAPIPHAPPEEEENRPDSGLIQPERSDSKPIDHKRMRSSTTTAATLPIFRQHPGEEVDLGESKVGRIRSSSLHRLLMR